MKIRCRCDFPCIKQGAALASHLHCDSSTALVLAANCSGGGRALGDCHKDDHALVEVCGVRNLMRPDENALVDIL